MALTDEEKLVVIKEAFIRKIESVDEYATMVSFIQNITTAQLKAVISNSINNDADNFEDSAVDATATAGNYDDLATEVDNF